MTGAACMHEELTAIGDLAAVRLLAVLGQKKKEIIDSDRSVAIKVYRGVRGVAVARQQHQQIVDTYVATAIKISWRAARSLQLARPVVGGGD